MKKFSAKILFCATTFLGIAAFLLRAQSPPGLSGKGFLFPYRDNAGILKAILTGKTAKQVTGSRVFVTDFKMKSLNNGDTNLVELIAEAPECLIDRSNNIAASSGAMKAYTATTNLYIEGVGFFLQQSNAFLVISNNVETIIHKNSFKTNSSAAPSSLATTSTNDLLKIFSAQSGNKSDEVAFRFLYESNLVTYTGNVRAEDSQMELNCDLLNIFLTTNRTIYRIVADDHVVIINKKDRSRATGQHAVYSIQTNGEFVELTGEPFWTDGQREGKADKFVFDRTNNLFRAEQNAVFKVPRDKVGQPDLLIASATPTLTNTPSTNPVVISATFITFQMPPTNGPIQEMIAQTNVVITSASDESRATADRAHYHESTGLMELTGHPDWKLKQSELKGEIIIVGKTNHFVAARTNVYLQMPATMFGKSLGATGTNSAAITNQIVEVLSETFSYNTNVATFREHVRAKTIDANLSTTTLNSEFLQVYFSASNQVEKVFANQNVALHQLVGAAAQSKVLEKTVTGDLMMLNRWPETGLLREIHAENKVVGEQIEQSPIGKSIKRISAELVDIKFLPTTNQIQEIVADQNVLAEKIDVLAATNKSASATGERAVYDAVKQVAEFTGNPSAKSDDRMLTNAIVLRWDLRTGKTSATGRNKIIPLNTTNALNSLSKSQP